MKEIIRPPKGATEIMAVFPAGSAEVYQFSSLDHAEAYRADGWIVWLPSIEAGGWHRREAPHE